MVVITMVSSPYVWTNHTNHQCSREKRCLYHLSNSACCYIFTYTSFLAVHVLLHLLFCPIHTLHNYVIVYRVHSTIIILLCTQTCHVAIISRDIDRDRDRSPRLFNCITYVRGHLDTPPKIFSGGKTSLVTFIATDTPRNAIDLHRLGFVTFATSELALQCRLMEKALAKSPVNFRRVQVTLRVCDYERMFSVIPRLQKRFTIQQLM